MFATMLEGLLSVAVGMLSPRNLRISDEWYTRFRVSWEPVSSPIQGYRLIYSPKGQGLTDRPSSELNARLSEFVFLFPGKDQPISLFVGDVTSFTPTNLQPGTTYDVKVLAQYTTGISVPLIGVGTTRRLQTAD